MNLDKNKGYVVKININDKDILEKIKKETNAPYSQIISKLLKMYSSKDDKQKNQELEQIKENKFYYSDENKVLKIRLTSNEYDNLKNFCKSTGFKSVTKQAKFLILNLLHKEKFFHNTQINEFVKLRSEMARDYKNLYQLLKKLRERNFVKINDKVLADIVKNLDTNTEKLLESFGKIIEKNNERF